MEKFVSVIIPTYNRSALVQIAIDSVLNQTHVNLELVIVDDGSDDDTGDLIDHYKQISAKQIVAVHQENKGPAAARNHGIAVSSSEYIAFLDSRGRQLSDIAHPGDLVSRWHAVESEEQTPKRVGLYI